MVVREFACDATHGVMPYLYLKVSRRWSSLGRHDIEAVIITIHSIQSVYISSGTLHMIPDVLLVALATNILDDIVALLKANLADERSALEQKMYG